MEQFKKIIDYVNKIIQLTEEEEAIFLSKLKFKKVKKRQFIVQPDFVCKVRSFVVSGALRSYVVCNAGEEHIIALAIDTWWISDFNSYIYQQPATLFVEAMEDSELIQISYEDEQKLLQEVPKFERFFKIITERGFAFLQRRVLSNLSKTAEMRYEQFAEQYPEMLQKIPQYAIASYLGMTPVYLSQLRNNRPKKVKLL